MKAPARAPERSKARERLWPLLAIAAFALCLVLPLILHGPSCGHDFSFHLQSWIDAAQQIRHGDLLPRWAFSPAYNAGEPRFIFYPPVSWLLGSVLLLVFPAASITTLYTWLCFSAAGWSMYRLSRGYATRNAVAARLRHLHREPIPALHRIRAHGVRGTARGRMDAAALRRRACPRTFRTAHRGSHRAVMADQRARRRDGHIRLCRSSCSRDSPSSAFTPGLAPHRSAWDLLRSAALGLVLG